MSETNLSRSTSSPDPFLVATLDPDYIQLREHIRRLHRVPLGSDTKSVDAAWEVYKNLREESLGYCRKLIHKSRGYSLIAQSAHGKLVLGSTSTDACAKRATDGILLSSQVLALWTRDHRIAVHQTTMPLYRVQSIPSGHRLFATTKKYRKSCSRLFMTT
jgi:hypothetical protein